MLTLLLSHLRRFLGNLLRAFAISADDYAAMSSGGGKPSGQLPPPLPPLHAADELSFKKRDIFASVQNAVKQTVQEAAGTSGEKEARVIQNIYNSAAAAAADINSKAKRGKSREEIALPLLKMYREISQIIREVDSGRN